MYKSIDLKENPRDLEARVRTYWQEHDTAKKSIDFRENNPQFIFYEGPPRQMANREFTMCWQEP